MILFLPLSTKPAMSRAEFNRYCESWQPIIQKWKESPHTKYGEDVDAMLKYFGLMEDI